MKAKQSSKVRSFKTLQLVFDKHEATWKAIPAFEKAVDEFHEIIPEINSALQIQASQGGATEEKTLAQEQMANAAYEIASAVAAYAAANEDPALEKRTGLSRSAVTDGKENEIAARCTDIIEAAQANVDSLGDVGVTQAKITALKNKVKAYEGLLGKPREAIGTSSAATKKLEVLLDRADMILGRRLDRLSVQFKESAPEFYDSYQAARSVVDLSSGRSSKGKNSANGGSTPTPLPQPA